MLSHTLRGPIAPLRIMPYGPRYVIPLHNCKDLKFRQTSMQKFLQSYRYIIPITKLGGNTGQKQRSGLLEGKVRALRNAQALLRELMMAQWWKKGSVCENTNYLTNYNCSHKRIICEIGLPLQKTGPIVAFVKRHYRY